MEKPSHGLTAFLWMAWLACLTIGTLVSYPEKSIGPPALIVALIGYPLYFSAFVRSWKHSWSLTLSFAIMHLWYLTAFLGLLEALEVANIFGLFLLTAFLFFCFAAPLIYAHWAAAKVEKHQSSLTDIMWRVVLVVIIVMSFFVFAGLSLNAFEMVKANNFRDFCKTSVTGMSMESIKARITSSTPDRFLKMRGNDLEISSHGRGCIVTFQDGKAVVQRLLPESGFWWMLTGRPDQSLKGAFE